MDTLKADLNRRVRIIGKIRPFLDSEIDYSTESKARWLSVQKVYEESADNVEIVFERDRTTTISRKETFKLDDCYEPDKNVADIFDKEVKPLLQDVLNGLNSSVLAYGARASGKTYTIQGSIEKPGLAPLTVAEILSNGLHNESSVSISCYEVYQEKVYDLLSPNESEVMVLEDGTGRVQLKGLSKVPIKSISEFYKFYFHGCNHRKPTQRTHKGLTIHLSCKSKDDEACQGKITFVDLAGYEDIKHKTKDDPYLLECSRINRSLCALLNVVSALNAKENHIPYREHKLTRILKDFIGRTSRNLLITCLNPNLQQETIHTILLASRACYASNVVVHGSTKSTKSKPRLTARTPFSGLNQTPFATKKLDGSLSIQRSRTNSVMKSCTSSKFLERKNVDGSSALKGRKLFLNTMIDVRSTENKAASDGSKTIELDRTKEEAILSDCAESTKSSILTEVYCIQERDKFKVSDVFDTNSVSNTESLMIDSDGKAEKENTPTKNGVSSPPLSARLRGLTNVLMSLQTPVSLNLNTPLVNSSCCDRVFKDPIEPKTPSITFNARINGNWEDTVTGTPREIYSARSSGLKKSLVEEYLRFLNTANKEELKELKGIGEKRATYILELREQSPMPFKDLNDLKEIGIPLKQINVMMRKVAGQLFT